MRDFAREFRFDAAPSAAFAMRAQVPMVGPFPQSIMAKARSKRADRIVTGIAGEDFK